MRSLPILIIILIILTGTIVIVSAEDTKTDIHPLPLPVRQTVQYQPVQMFSPDLIEAAQQMIGEVPMDEQVSVIYGDQVLAVIPPDSKFIDVPVTDECLKFQYGTDNWYECETVQQ